jgi:hypothetical protein
MVPPTPPLVSSPDVIGAPAPAGFRVLLRVLFFAVLFRAVDFLAGLFRTTLFFLVDFVAVFFFAVERLAVDFFFVAIVALLSKLVGEAIGQQAYHEFR